MGYSDNTNFTFLYTLLSDTASLYGACVENFGMKEWHPSLKEAYEIMRGERTSQKSYDLFAVNDISHEENMALAPYDLSEKTDIRVLNGSDIRVRGRLLGGCLDCLVPLIGTPYDKVAEFAQRYEKDGLLFYLEACDLNPVSVIRSLLQMKDAGWFDHANAILFGREKIREPFFEMTFEDALHQVFDGSDIPVVYGLDFGHVPPSWTLINGSVAGLEVKDHKAEIKEEFL